MTKYETRGGFTMFKITFLNDQQDYPKYHKNYFYSLKSPFRSTVSIGKNAKSLNAEMEIQP